jgi:hypothetical protein
MEGIKWSELHSIKTLGALSKDAIKNFTNLDCMSSVMKLMESLPRIMLERQRTFMVE